jgi:hypothetical protein
MRLLLIGTGTLSCCAEDTLQCMNSLWLNLYKRFLLKSLKFHQSHIPVEAASIAGARSINEY